MAFHTLLAGIADLTSQISTLLSCVSWGVTHGYIHVVYRDLNIHIYVIFSPKTSKPASHFLQKIPLNKSPYPDILHLSTSQGHQDFITSIPAHSQLLSHVGMRPPQNCLLVLVQPTNRLVRADCKSFFLFLFKFFSLKFKTISSENTAEIASKVSCTFPSATESSVVYRTEYVIHYYSRLSFLGFEIPLQKWRTLWIQQMCAHSHRSKAWPKISH